MSRLTLTLMSLFLVISIAAGQQTADPSYKPIVGESAFAPDMGPVIFIDEAHHNFHTAGGGYKPFADLLLAHNCTVLPSREEITLEHLRNCDIFVIANALAERNVQEWSLPVDEALKDMEIDALDQWVREGGSLFLIADHMPMPGAVDKLAKRFGVTFSNGFAMYKGMRTRGLLFIRDNETLVSHWITDTRLDGVRVDSVVSFTGSAFRVEVSHRPLLIFGEDMVSLEPETAWEFTESTKKVNIEGWRQGAAFEHGKGRVVVFGEAAMFTAQYGGRGTIAVGMHTPEGAHNSRLLLNIIRWLAVGKAG
jgi:hypothetical protein